MARALATHEADCNSPARRYSGLLLQLAITSLLVACGGGGSGGGESAPAPMGGGFTSFLTDNGIHAPPTTGAFGYNTFMPGTAGFPAVGGTYVDPVFGGVVRRLSARNSAGNDQMYAHHFANANGTYAFQLSGSIGRVISTTTGAVIWSGVQVPIGSHSEDLAWDAVDPDKYYYYNGADLMRRNLTAQTDTTMHTFAATIDSSGGSLNTQSADGRYFTVSYSGANKVWDSQTNTLYSGSVTLIGGGGWVAITPDGNYLVTAAGPTALPQKEHYSYAINHVTQSIASSPTQFWGVAGDHGVLVSASDGKNYFITFDGYTAGLWRVDITLNQASNTPTQQEAANFQLIALAFADSDGHLSAVSKGAFRDWVFYDNESFADSYNSSTAGWTAYRQEVMAINVLTGEVRRLAHHRSRYDSTNPTGTYWNQPRVSCSWDGSVVLFDSNFNTSSPVGYADLYAIQSPL